MENMLRHIFSVYNDRLIVELLGFALEKANADEYDENVDYEDLFERIYYLSVEMRNRKIKYINLVVDNSDGKDSSNKTKKGKKHDRT